MKIVHVSDGWEPWNGAANIARLIAGEQSSAGNEVVFRRWAGVSELKRADEVWVHCGWKPCLWWAALWGRNVKWMPEACYDPIRRAFHGWKKWLVGPVERFCLRRCDALVACCAGEAEWIKEYLGRKCPQVEVTDVRRFFKFNGCSARLRREGPLRVLFLGRRHPLKGVVYLEQAVETINGEATSPSLQDKDVNASNRSVQEASSTIELRLVSNHFGEELERDWEWTDVLCLPTLSENFGLVVAEALERGKPVITTDGAPAWEGQPGVVYLKGYRDGTDAERVELLKDALVRFAERIEV